MDSRSVPSGIDYAGTMSEDLSGASGSRSRARARGTENVCRPENRSACDAPRLHDCDQMESRGLEKKG